MIKTFFLRKNSYDNQIYIEIDKSFCIMELENDGKILSVNKKFLDILEYNIQEIQGKDHNILIDPALIGEKDYKNFWFALSQGQFQAGQFKRIGKGGKEIWIEASYNPIPGSDGHPRKIVVHATDITQRMQEYVDLRGQVRAINVSQAVIEFNLDGTVITANDNFLKLLGYTLDEVRGRHHGMFVEAAYRNSAEYREFWAMLNRGTYQAAQFKRIGKSGQAVWIEASYNPVFDLDGRLVKVVKYATEITKQVELMAHLKTMIDRNFGEIDHAMSHTTAQANAAARKATETSGDMQVIAASAEQLAASINEISDTMTKSKLATDTAHGQTVAADQATKRLTEAAGAMGSIVGLIQNIAHQINLLALNATIESARAGDAGKGFAVVAGEVKNLAKQASHATDRISTEIERMQEVSGEVASALGIIGQSIDTVREYVAGTVSAVEEQSSVTKGISESMNNIAGALSIFSGNIGEIVSSVDHATRAVANTKEAAMVLAR